MAKNTSVKATTYPDNEFNAGTVAMAFAGSFLVPGINSGVGDKFEYASAVMPRDVAAATDLGGNAIVAAKDGKNTEAAAKFLEFIVREDQMKTFCEKTNVLPTLKSLTETKLDFKIRPDLMQPFVLAGSTITPEQVRQVTVPQFAKLNTALQNELEKAFLGGRNAADTVTALADAVQKAVGVTATPAAPSLAPQRTGRSDGGLRGPRRARWDRSAVLFVAPALLLALAFLIVPLIGAFVYSTAKIATLSGKVTWVGFANYATMFSRPDVLPIAAQHRAVHRADRAAEHGGRARARGLDELGAAGAEGVPDPHLPARWSSPAWRWASSARSCSTRPSVS